MADEGIQETEDALDEGLLDYDLYDEEEENELVQEEEKPEQKQMKEPEKEEEERASDHDESENIEHQEEEEEKKNEENLDEEPQLVEPEDTVMDRVLNERLDSSGMLNEYEYSEVAEDAIDLEEEVVLDATLVTAKQVCFLLKYL